MGHGGHTQETQIAPTSEFRLEFPANEEDMNLEDSDHAGPELVRAPTCSEAVQAATECSICYYHLCEPIQWSTCGHTFCRLCAFKVPSREIQRMNCIRAYSACTGMHCSAWACTAVHGHALQCMPGTLHALHTLHAIHMTTIQYIRCSIAAYSYSVAIVRGAHLRNREPCFQSHSFCYTSCFVFAPPGDVLEFALPDVPHRGHCRYRCRRASRRPSARGQAHRTHTPGAVPPPTPRATA